MIIENICTKQTYMQGEEEKTKWLICGTLRTMDNGNKFIQLNHLPDVSFYVFKPKPRETEGL